VQNAGDMTPRAACRYASLRARLREHRAALVAAAGRYDAAIAALRDDLQARLTKATSIQNVRCSAFLRLVATAGYVRALLRPSQLMRGSLMTTACVMQPPYSSNLQLMCVTMLPPVQALRHFVLEVGKAAEYPRTGVRLSEAAVARLHKADSAREETLIGLRLKNIELHTKCGATAAFPLQSIHTRTWSRCQVLQDTGVLHTFRRLLEDRLACLHAQIGAATFTTICRIARLEATVREREQLAEGLHLIDFEQLKVESQALHEKADERGEEVLRLKRKITATVQARRRAAPATTLCWLQAVSRLAGTPTANYRAECACFSMLEQVACHPDNTVSDYAS
jgi:Domain of unknown function (DUF4201)